jgi:hypothetical protein
VIRLAGLRPGHSEKVERAIEYDVCQTYLRNNELRQEKQKWGRVRLGFKEHQATNEDLSSGEK